MEQQLNQPSHRHLAVILFMFIFVFSSASNAAQVTIQPVEHIGLLQRQVIEASFIDPNKIDSLVVYVGQGDFDDPTATDEEIWLEKTEGSALISKGTDQEFSVNYEDQVIASSEEVWFDYVQLEEVCRGPDSRHRLLFRMVAGGTANGELEDMLFVYYDPNSQSFQHQVIAERYLAPLCDMEGGIASEQQVEKKSRKREHVFKQLRPSLTPTDLEPFIQSGKPIPTRQFSYDELEGLLGEISGLMPSETSPDDDSEEEIDYFAPKLVIKELDADDHWRIVKVTALELWASWGVLLVENKWSGQWTSFYNITPGDSNTPLYLSDDIELVGNGLKGLFNPYSDHRVEISLDYFRVKKTHEYRFSDYPIKPISVGSIAELDTESDDIAQILPTRIRQQLDAGANFAGHYSLMESGCGTECQVIVITDAISGKVVAELSARTGVEYRADSQLLVQNTECFEDAPCEQVFYQLVSGKLVRLD